MQDETPGSSPGALQPAFEGDLDAALVHARAGDEHGFLELWRALQPMLLRYLRVYDGAGHEDVAAETWLHAVRDLSQFKGDAADFRRWLFTIARHRAIDAGRSRALRPLVLVGDARSLLHQTSSPSAEEQVMESMSTDDALALLGRLPVAQRELVALRVLADLDVATVADIVGISAGAVRVGVHRALKTLSDRAGVTSVEVEVP
ncbi:MAG: polymerase, sigma-24 subunit, subfamily [Frankiales bacterium]|nr:polymerase, sigma-24 subunit, subfamily [Frankiales bacterium]